MRIVMVMSSTSAPADTSAAQLAQLKAFAGPFYVFRDAGHDVTLASPLGGAPPIAWPPPAQVADPLLARYRQDRDARDLLSDTLVLDQVYPEDFQLAFYPGCRAQDRLGMRDLAASASSRRLLLALWQRAPIALVGSAVAALCDLTDAEGRPLVAGRQVTASDGQDVWTSAGERGRRLEDELRALGAFYQRREAGDLQVVVDGLLVTAQGDAASCEAARIAVGLAAP